MSELTQTQYDEEIQDMAEYVLEQMRESSAATREEWNEERLEYVWRAVENCSIRYDEDNYDKIIECSNANFKWNYEDKGQKVREMMEEDVIMMMDKLPQKDINSTSY